jgi:hypothetical protein
MNMKRISSLRFNGFVRLDVLDGAVPVAHPVHEKHSRI